MNTIVNFVVCMYAMIQHDPTGDWDNMSRSLIAGGDDSLVYFNDARICPVFESVTQQFGLTVKAKAVPSNTPVRFLSLVYPNARAGPEIMPDFRRVLNKLVMCNATFDSIHGCALKLNGYLTMFPDAPLLSQMMRSYLLKLGPYLDEKVVVKFNDTAQLPYSLRMGSPRILQDETCALDGQDPEAVEAVLMIIDHLEKYDIMDLRLDLHGTNVSTDNQAKGYQNIAITKANDVALTRHSATVPGTRSSPDGAHVMSAPNLDKFVQFVQRREGLLVLEGSPNLLTAALVKNKVHFALKSKEADKYNLDDTCQTIASDKIKYDNIIDLSLTSKQPPNGRILCRLFYETDIMQLDHDSLFYTCLCEGQVMVSRARIGKPLAEYTPLKPNAAPVEQVLEDRTTKEQAIAFMISKIPEAVQKGQDHLAKGFPLTKAVSKGTVTKRKGK